MSEIKEETVIKEKEFEDYEVQIIVFLNSCLINSLNPS